jgi:hypothetical protein
MPATGFRPLSLLSVTGPVALAFAPSSLLFEQPAASKAATANVAATDIKRFKSELLKEKECVRVSATRRAHPPNASKLRKGRRAGNAYLDSQMKRPMPTDGPSPMPFVRRAVLGLVWAERIVFVAIGIMLFAAAILFLKQSVVVLYGMLVATSESPSTFGSQFLDVILLVLMIVELAYTVILSLRGAVLMAEPFLIVGLIAVIRRMLVITVGEMGPHGTNVSQSIGELGILTGIVVVFVGSIALLRARPPVADSLGADDPLA